MKMKKNIELKLGTHIIPYEYVHENNTKVFFFWTVVFSCQQVMTAADRDANFW